MLKDIIILVLVGYLVSRVFKFLVPIFRVSSVANEHIRRMQERMKNMDSQMNQPQPRQGQRQSVKKEGDYIDYEEV